MMEGQVGWIMQGQSGWMVEGHSGWMMEILQAEVVGLAEVHFVVVAPKVEGAWLH